ncbi:MAG: PKD domain-containing protein, partial [Candidatus Nanohalobium sp.]
TDTAREYVNVNLDDDGDNGDEDNGDTEEPNDAPTAKFSYSPSSPRVGQQVTFDASSSSDDSGIVDYSWSFGDGDSSSGSTVTHTFEETGNYPVSLTVEDSEGETDTTMKYVNVGLERGACGVSEDTIYFSLDEYTIQSGDSTQAKLQVYNTGSRDQRVRVEIEAGTEVVRTKTVTVSSGSSRTVSTSVSPERDAFISAKVETLGSPCGYKTYDNFNKELIVLAGGDGDEKEAASLEVKAVSDGGPVRNARVEISGPEDIVRYTDRYGKRDFSIEPGDYDVEVYRAGYGTVEKSVSLSAGEDEQLTFNLERDEEGTGTLEINVVNGNGDDVEDARVEVENGDTEIERTDEDGFARFDLSPGDYDVEVTHPDYSGTATTSVNIDEGETDSRTLTLFKDEEDGVEIVSTDFPSSVCRGDTLTVDYTVRNNEGYDKSAQTTASGLGSSIITNTYVIDSGESVSGTLRFTNVQGSGTETFNIRVRNGARAEVSGTVTVKDCTTQEPVDQDASAVSMKLSYPVPPNKALVGDTVKVSGFVEGVSSRTQVSINVNGKRKARVSTQPDGYYQTFIRMDSVGMKTVAARAGGKSASREIQVLPTASVGMVNAPRKVFEGEKFEVCSEVTSQVEAKVLLLEDGRILESTNANGQVCFDVNASEVGRHVYEVRALTSGEGASSTTTVEVLETDVETRSFPNQIASVESGSGMVRVELYNTHQEEKRYKLRLEDLPSTWLSQSRKEVILSPGERRTVYFYLTPREEGSYDPTVVVTADNQQVYRQKVDLYTGGQTEPRQKGFLEKLSSFFGL